MKEEWKAVVNYEGLYEVSNMGNVRSLDRKSLHWRGTIRNLKGKTLKKLKDSQGRLRVNLYKGGSFQARKIHQLVAETFLGHIPCGMKIVVDHINNDKLDNRSVNLQLISNRRNLSKKSIKG